MYNLSFNITWFHDRIVTRLVVKVVFSENVSYIWDKQIFFLGKNKIVGKLGNSSNDHNAFLIILHIYVMDCFSFGISKYFLDENYPIFLSNYSAHVRNYSPHLTFI